MQYLTGVLITPYHFGIPIGQQVHMNFLMENVRFSRVIRGNDPSRCLRGSSEFHNRMYARHWSRAPLDKFKFGTSFEARVGTRCKAFQRSA